MRTKNERITEGKVEPEITVIERVVRENSDTKTIYVKKRVEAAPGQFAMLWIPGADEKPMSFSGVGKGTSFTVKKVGPFTERLHKLKAGDKLGLRGPYGRGFGVKGRRVCLVAGGCGAAPLLPLARKLRGRDVTIIVAAKTRQELLFTKEFGKCGKLVVATDDGSEGRKGFATDALAELLSTKKFDRIYACGKEQMLAKVVKLAVKHKTPLEVATERYMKCGVGICGQCTIGGRLACVDGPIFTEKELFGTEFGRLHQNKCGCTVGLNRG